jgi:hypothetical protein
LLTILQGFKAISLNFGKMDEQIVTTFKPDEREEVSYSCSQRESTSRDTEQGSSPDKDVSIHGYNLNQPAL